jgi:uncharacterized protein YgiM (DUF1202 family)
MRYLTSSPIGRISAFALSVVAAHAFAAEEKAPYVAEVSGNRVNVRAGSSTNYRIIKVANAGQKFVVRGIDNGWAKIDVPKSVYVFVSKKYVRAGKNGQGIVIADQVNIRPEPNIRRAAMCQVKKNETVRIIEAAGEFYKIEPPAETFAYISAKYIRYFGDLEKMVKDVETKQESDSHVAAVIALDKEASEKGTTREELASLVGKYQSLMSDNKVGEELKTHIAQRLANLAELKQMFALKEQNEKLIQKLGESNQQIEKISLRAETLARKAQENEEKIAELKYVAPPPPTYTGKGEIKSLVRLWNSPGTHKLVNDKGETLFILQSDSHDLEGFIGKSVGINGELQDLRGWRTRLLHVDEIDVINELAKN